MITVEKLCLIKVLLHNLVQFYFFALMASVMNFVFVSLSWYHSPILYSPVRGYQSQSTNGETRFSLLDMNIEQETIRELSQRKQALLMELKNYQVCVVRAMDGLEVL